jgi:Rrf2 family protein
MLSEKSKQGELIVAVNTRTEYTLRALLTIMEKAGDPISAAEICKIESLPKKYIEHLLAGLKNAEVVHSLPGSKGGYILAKEASRINLFDIMKAVEDVAWELSCTQRRR